MREVTALCLAAALIAGGAAAESTVFAEPAAAGGTLSSDAVMEAVREAERAIRDLSLDFTQKTVLKGMGEEQVVTGRVRMLRKPERFRMEYLTPVRQVMVYDGTRLLLYLPETGQAFRQKADMKELRRLLGFDPSSPVDFLSGGQAAELEGCAGGKCTLRLVPSETGGTVWRVRLDVRTWLVDEVSFDNSDMTLSIRCDNYRVNRGLTAKSFRFRIPPGTEVEEGLPMMTTPGASK